MLAKMITAFVTVSEGAGLTVSEKKIVVVLLLTPKHTTLAQPLVLEAAGQRY